ncbi:chromosome segregation protein Cse1 [Blumeria hordei DH14]|uniref:Chromosome segregation protein Cse1 n=1 Tax=Blumeria graminis f. sp. hordei (strain DH14) TaxID=546991 RepID=N1JCT6_BLUG1|nr:chromosome segregation protein Cse1 [Blumeria hordei DH14]
MTSNIEVIVQQLQATLDPREHKQAEAALKAEETKPGFSLLLLNIIASETLPLGTRLSAALCFKNFIKYKWVDDAGDHRLTEDEVKTIKRELIGLMVTVPGNLRAQLGEAISLIADSDFWTRWDNLVDDLVSLLTQDNPQINVGVLEVAHSIFKRWRPLFASDGLYTEINHVLEKFGQPFVQLLASTDQQIAANKDNKDVLEQHIKVMNLLVKLFYDLSCQDLPPIFEDNLADITSLLHKYLTYENSLLNKDDDLEAGPLEYVKAGTCEVMTLYMQKYEDAFGTLCQPFITSTWALLTTTGSEIKFDILVSKALQFLTAVASLDAHAINFNNEEVLRQVVEKVIIPNVSLRDSDIEQFEDEPIEYIRRDFEGSDADTRRRAATDFLQKLLQNFVAPVTSTVGKYISHYLDLYRGSSGAEWKIKDTALYLFTTIASTSAVTASHGVKTTNSLVDIVDFFQNNIANDLVAETGVQPILKVDAIKFLYTFRSQLTKAQWVAALPPLVKNLKSSNYVVYTYTSIAVERVLSLTTSEGKYLFREEEITPFSKDLLEHLFQLIQKDLSPEKVQENEFLMRCVMRVLIVIKTGITPIVENVLSHLKKITEIIRVNPSNPKFYYYHFEALGSVIKNATHLQPGKLEEELYAPFAAILHNDVQEFTPYVFQLFSALIEYHWDGPLPDYYKSLVTPILSPSLWESKGNVPALVRLLSTLIPKCMSDIVANNQLDPILGIFQSLIRKVKTELLAYDILEAIITSCEVSMIESYFPSILTLLFARMNSQPPPEKFKQRFVRFYHLVSSRDQFGLGADFFIKHAESLQTGVFAGVYLTIILPTTQQLVRPIDRKLAVISLTKTLTDSESFAVKYAKAGWGKTCDALLRLLETPPAPTVGTDEVVENDVDDLSFGIGFTPLNTCKEPSKDRWPEVVNVKSWVGSYVKEADSRHSGAIGRFADQRLRPEAKNVLVSYMQ